MVEHRDGVVFGKAADADAKAGHAERVVAEKYDPDLEVYKPDPANDQAAELTSLVREGKVQLDLRLTCRDGRREAIRLHEFEVAAYLESDVPGRARIANAKIAERRFATAAAAAQRHQSGQVIRVSADEEACLREFDAVVERRVAREGKDAHGYEKRLVIRESFRRKASSLKRLREDFFDAPMAADGAYGTFLSPTQREYVAWGGPGAEQVSIGDRWDALAKSRYAYTHDPVIRHGCHILADFVLGRGVGLVAKHPAVQRVVDEFIDRVQLNDKLHPMAVALSRDGNLLVRKIPIGDGRLKIAGVHPATIWEIVTDAEDVNDVYAYAQRYQTRTQQITIGQDAAMSRYIERIIPADKILHAKVNASEWDIWGRSDIFPALGWAKRRRDYLDAAVQKEQAAASYQWHYKTQGGSADVSRIAAAIGGAAPIPGSSFVTNAAVDVEAVKPATTGGIAKEGGTYECLINEIAVAFGLSKDYFGAASRNTRASALIATEPAAKRFEQRQGVISAFIEALMQDVVDEARNHGLIQPQDDEDDKIDESFRVVFPTIITADSDTRIKQLNGAVASGVIGHKRYAEEYSGELELDEYEYDAEMNAIKDEIGVEGWMLANKDAAPVKRALPSIDDPAFDPGRVANPADKNVTPGGAPAPAGDATDPTSQAGKTAIKNVLGSGDQRGMGVHEAARVLSESGAVVILP